MEGSCIPSIPPALYGFGDCEVESLWVAYKPVLRITVFFFIGREVPRAVTYVHRNHRKLRSLKFSMSLIHFE